MIVLGNLAESAGLVGLDQDDVAMPTRPQSGMLGKMASHWIVIARDRDHLGPLTRDPRWRPLVPDNKVSLWTDDFSNLLEVFEWPKTPQ